MELIAASALSAEQKSLVSGLFSACREWEGLTLSFPSDDGDFFVLCIEGGILVSALALYQLDSHLYECTAATHPEHRRKGCFSQALELAESRFRNSDFSFVTDGHCPSAAFVLKKLNARFWYKEHMMRLELSGWIPPVHVLPPSFSVTVEDGGSFTAFVRGRKIGSCRVSPLGSGVYLYGMEILPSFRGKGFGNAFFIQVLKHLQKTAASVTLQVAGSNTAALNLYKKAGFLITETLSYYLY